METKELELLERVFLRLGMAETDSQLEATLARFLPAILLKTASTSSAVHAKVMELLNHVSKRLKSRPQVQLPVEQLLAQFTNQTSSSAVVNFSLVYVRYGYPRLPPAEQTRLLPSLLLSLSYRTAQQDSVLQLCVPALVHLEWPEDVKERCGLLPLSEHSQVRTVLLEFLLLYLLLPYGSLEVKAGQLPPAGLNRKLISRITGGATPSPEHLEQRKLAIVKLLSVEVMSPDEVVCPLIVASGDPKSSVAEVAEGHVRQFAHGLDWEKPGLIQQLMKLFLGTTPAPGKRPQSSQSSVASEPVSGCNLRVKIKILSFLLKSSLAANSFPQCVQLVFDGLFGSVTGPKLRSLTMEFAHHISRKATEQRLSVMAPILITGLQKIVERPDEEVRMKAMAYTGIGLLAQRAPAIFQKDPGHLLRLFQVFSDPGSPVDRDVGLAVQECMSLMAPAYQGVEGEKSLLLEAALLENIYSTSPQARIMAAVLATSSLFPFSHTPSRFVSMVACGDSQDNIREAGKKGLILPKPSEEGVNVVSIHPPSFPDMVHYFHKRATIMLQSGGCFSTAAGKLPFAPAIMSSALTFLWLCLEESAGVKDEERLADKIRAPVTLYLSGLVAAGRDEEVCVDQYLELLMKSLGPAGDLELHSVAMVGLLRLTVASPGKIAPQLLPQLTWIRGFTQSSRGSVSEPAGQLLGTLSHHLSNEEFLSVITQVYMDTFTKTHYIQLGAVMALGHLISAAVSRVNVTAASSDKEHQHIQQTMRKSLYRLVCLLDGGLGHVHLVSPACAALGHACGGGTLPLDNQSLTEETEEGEERVLNKGDLIARLKKLLKNSKDFRTRELCAVALGRMGVFECDSTHCHALLEALFSVREEKAVELQFTVGEALSCVAAGPLSTALHNPWDGQHTTTHSKSSDKDLGQLQQTLDAILSDHAPHPLASVRQSACVWLLCILKHASAHPDMRNHLKRLQTAFMNFLAETNEITQEVASRGLGLTYELCDDSTKQEMVQSLLGTLMEGRKIEQKMTDETEVFKQGELGKPPEGKGLSTYKELCSIASDLNKPDLIYKFMHLANHNALWNSKKGAAFGFSTIAATAREELAPHLPLLVPRLYRYKYDPNPRIQLAMTSIWTAVVPESKKAIDKYLPAILDDLSQNLNSHLWRNREASCMALSDLLIGQEARDVASHLPSLWELTLRARDDIKETVRKAADAACKSLHKVTVRACESPTAGPKVIGEVLPLMLTKGMQNPSSDVRKISLLTIHKMSENAGSLLKPHIPVLVPTLLESLSSLELQELNTLSLRLAGETEVLEQLDNIRVKASRKSPMMETIELVRQAHINALIMSTAALVDFAEKCIPHVDVDVLPGLIPRLVEVLKSGVGLGTKAATAQLIVSLVRSCRNDLTPYSGKLLTALTSGLTDRSVGVRKSSAQAIGHLVKVSKSLTVKKFLDKMNKWYFEKYDSQVQANVALVFHAISRHSADTAGSMMADFIPLVFLAMHTKTTEEDPSSKTTHKQWQETWNELVPGEEATVRLYLPQLVGVASTALQSQFWPIKAQGASALATVTEKMGTSLPTDQLTTILTTLLDGLQGRTWDGKEALLKALRKVCTHVKMATLITSTATSTSSLPSPIIITTALLTQCRKKQDHTYQAAAMETLGGVASTLEVDVFAEFSKISFPVLLPPTDDGGSGDEEEEEERREKTSQILLLREKTAEAVGKTWSCSSPETKAIHFSGTLATLSSALPLYTWRIQLALVTALFSLFNKLNIERISDSDMTFIASTTIPSVCKCSADVKYSALRQAALKTLDKLTAQLTSTGQLQALPDSATSALREGLAAATDPQSKTLAASITKRLD